MTFHFIVTADLFIKQLGLPRLAAFAGYPEEAFSTRPSWRKEARERL